MKLKVNEIFYSIQGESTFAGNPCVFIRLTGCNQRCHWCDTEYAFYQGEEFSIEQILEKVSQYDCKLIEITGGEPLIQPKCSELMQILLEKNYTVLLETGGSLSIANVPEEVIKVIDFKCPSSGMSHYNLWSILEDAQPYDEFKFVIANEEDYQWAKDRILQFDLTQFHTVLFSPVHETMHPQELSKLVLQDNLPVKVQLQMQKYIWPELTQGV